MKYSDVLEKTVITKTITEELELSIKGEQIAESMSVPKASRPLSECEIICYAAAFISYLIKHGYCAIKYGSECYTFKRNDKATKCAICGNEIKAECFVEQECLEKLIKERDRWEELAQIGAQNCQFDCEERKELERLKAENESLKLRLGEK